MTEDAARDEADLIRRCAGGDEAAWVEFVDLQGPLLTALARRMLLRSGDPGRPEDVDEVVGEVFLALLRRDRLLLRRYDPRWRVSTYLGVISRTAVSRLLRRRSRTESHLAREDRVPARTRPEEGPLAGLTAEERERARQRIHAALATLGRRDRLLLSLRFFDGLDYRALATALGVSPESVGPLLARAKRRLADRLPHL